jgi:phospholipase C
LPSFSVVSPNAPQSQHNGYSWKAGDAWIGKVVSAIENGPDWNSTAIFITWDDCGCFYDHVNPLAFGSTWGIRVPMVVVSPYARSGATDSSATTFSGILAFTEKLYGLAPLAGSDAAAYDFEGSFDFTQTPLLGVTMVREPVPAASARWIADHPIDPNDPT